MDLLLRLERGGPYLRQYGGPVAIPVVVDLLLRPVGPGAIVHAIRVAIPVVVDLLLRLLRL